MYAILLDQYRGGPANALIDAIVKAAAEAETPIFVEKEQVVGTLLSPAATKEALTSRLLLRINRNPTLIETLRKRLIDEPVVD